MLTQMQSINANVYNFEYKFVRDPKCPFPYFKYFKYKKTLYLNRRGFRVDVSLRNIYGVEKLVFHKSVRSSDEYFWYYNWLVKRIEHALNLIYADVPECAQRVFAPSYENEHDVTQFGFDSAFREIGHCLQQIVPSTIIVNRHLYYEYNR